MKSALKVITLLRVNVNLFQSCVRDTTEGQANALIVLEAISYKKENAFSQPYSTPTVSTTKVLTVQNAVKDTF